MNELSKYSHLNQEIWEKAEKIDGQPADEWRRTHDGKKIRKDDYADSESEYGWELEYIIPVSQGGTDDINNLRPCYWGP